MRKTHRSIFIKELKEAFSEIRGSINGQYGLLNLEIHEFLDFVHEQIEIENRENVIKALQIIERHFKSGNSDLINAIGVSFLEHLDLGLAVGVPGWANEVLPMSLRKPYEALRKYHKSDGHSS